MAKIKHIALTTNDPAKVAAFYKEALGLQEIRRSPSGNVFLTDGYINMAILNWKTEKDADVGANGPNYSGIHHIGFQVESLEQIAEKLAEAGSQPRHDVNQALGVGPGRQNHGNVEVKYSGPDGVMLDVSQTGWVGTSGLDY